jgi:hypothetical protein
VTPADVEGVVQLVTVRGHENALNPAGLAGVGSIAIVDLHRAGLGDAGVQAALQSVSDGVRLVSLHEIDPDLGSVPDDHANHVYAMGQAGWSSKAPAIHALYGDSESALGQLDAVAVADTFSFSDPQAFATTVFGVKLAMSGGTIPDPISGNGISGFASPNSALIDERYLYIRDDYVPEDGAPQVLALDVRDLGDGVFDTLATRTFRASGSGVPAHVLNALTASAHPVTRDLAVSYSDTPISGGGIFVFDTQDASSFTHARLPQPPEGQGLDLPGVTWNADGTRLFVTWDVYDTETFWKLQSRLLVFRVDAASGSAVLTDPEPTTPEVEPSAAFELPAVHPLRVYLLGSPPGEGEQVAVVTSPYQCFSEPCPDYPEMSRLDVYRLVGECGAEHLAGVELGTFVADLPNIERVKVNGRHLLLVGSGLGIQAYELQQ